MPNQLSVEQRDRLRVLEQIIGNGLNTCLEVVTALKTIGDQKLWREGFDSLEDYCFRKWGIRKSRIYQLIGHGAVVANLGDDSTVQNEAQTRPLLNLSPEDQVTVWNIALQIAHGSPPTGAQVRQALKEWKRTGSASEPPSNRHQPIPFPLRCPWSWKKIDKALLQLIREIDELLHARSYETKRLGPVQQNLRAIVEGLLPFSYGPTHDIYCGSDGPAKWQQIYQRSLTITGQRTFRQAEAIFFREMGKWPNRQWPLMPRYADDFYRLVAHVPHRELIGQEGEHGPS